MVRSRNRRRTTRQRRRNGPTALGLLIGLGALVCLAGAANALPDRPSEPGPATAFDVLKKHCARCHQKGALTDREKPAAGFGNILDMDALAKSPRVAPRNPDASRLYTMIMKGEMPHDVRQQLNPRPGPTANEIDVLRQWIAGLPERAPVSKPSPANTRYSFPLTVTTDKRRYNQGDRVTITVTAGKPCFLTLININNRGEATVVFPNDFDRENVIPAEEPQTVPRPDARYVFPVRRRGSERVVALCSLTKRNPRGIEHNFIEQRFTELGDWADFKRRHYGSDTKPEKAAYRTGRRNEIVLPDVSMWTATRFTVE